MKKLLAMMLAMAMALGCVGALAEETAPTGMTVQAGISLNADLVTMLTTEGADAETTAALIQNIVNIVNNLGLTAVIADNGCQADITLKDGTLLTVAAAGDENGVVAATDLLPDYVFTVSGETIQQLISQLQASVGAGLDVDALMETLSPHLEKIMAYAQEKTGEPEEVSVTFEDVVFTAKVPFNFTTKELVTMALEMVKDVASSEAMAPVVSQIEGFDVSQIDEALSQIEAASEEDLPATDAAMYSNENGDVYVAVKVAKDDEAITVDVGVFADRMCVHVAAGQQGQIALDIAPTESGAILSLKLDSQGVSAAVTMNLGVTEEGVAVQADVYFMTMDQPLVSLAAVMKQGGEITYPINAEGKTVISLEELMAQGEDGELAQQVMEAVQGNVFNLLGKAQQLMPDEINAILSMMMPSDEAAEAVAE